MPGVKNNQGLTSLKNVLGTRRDTPGTWHSASPGDRIVELEKIAMVWIGIVQ